MIKASSLSKAFGTAAGELTVLDGVDLDVKAGEFVGIVGASGAGKSTLLHIIGTLDRPSSGSVTVDGQDISGMPGDELARFRNRTIGFVFQFHHLMPEFNALENAMMPALMSNSMKHAEARERASRLLDELGLSGRLTHRPGELSGGEQQRVAVARALVMEPALVLADEPTGNLDTSTGNELFDLLHEVNRKHGTTFLVVTHNESLATTCSRVLRMKDGRIV